MGGGLGDVFDDFSGRWGPFEAIISSFCSSEIALTDSNTLRNQFWDRNQHESKMLKNHVLASIWGGPWGTSGPGERHFPAIGGKSVVSVTFSDV